MKITKRIEIDYGHRIPNHKSKCFSLHGHRGVIEATFTGPTIKDEGSELEGMVIDFTDIKTALMDVVDKTYDHTLVINQDDPLLTSLIKFRAETDLQDDTDAHFKMEIVEWIPTAENFARVIFWHLDEYMRDNFEWYGMRKVKGDLLRSFTLSKIRFYETPNGFADYSGMKAGEDD